MRSPHSAPLNALRAFETAARLLSFQEAAAQLFVTPAAVSHQVKRLEAHLGLTLFRRGHREVVLTPEGESLAASLREVFTMLDLALTRVSAVQERTLRVSTMESFAAKWLAPRLHRFHRDYPDVRLHIVTGNELTDFARDGIDIAIRYGAGPYPGVSAERFLDAPAYPVCAPGLLGGDNPPLHHPIDLRHYTLLHDESARGRAGVPDWRDWLNAGGAAIDPGDGPTFSSIYLAQEAAVAGHGVALGLAPLVEEDLARGRLVKPFELPLANEYAFWIITSNQARVNAATHAFRDWLKAEAGGKAC